MKYTLFIITYLLVSSMSVQSQTITANNDSIIVQNFNKQDLYTITANIEAENEKLAKRLATLEKQMMDNGSVVQMLKNANQEKFKVSLGNLEQRYIAGERILFHIIKELNQLNLSFSQLVLQEEMMRLSNPSSYAAFNESLNTSIKTLNEKKLLPEASSVSDMQQQIPMIFNPILSSSFSLVSLFLARYQKKSLVKKESLGQLSCILDYTNQIKEDYQVVSAILNNLNHRIDAFQASTNFFFTEYLAAIHYSGGYEQYVADRIQLSYNFMDKERTSFFNKLLADTATISMLNFESNKDDEVQFSVEQVKFYLNEYELILLEIKDVMENYQLFIQKQQMVDEEICPQLSKEVSTQFESIDNKLQEVLANFNVVYEENRIEKNTKRILFGF